LLICKESRATPLKRKFHDNARRRAAISAIAGNLSQLPGRHMAENQRVRVVGFGGQ
jgi:hypothetical protein